MLGLVASLAVLVLSVGAAWADPAEQAGQTAMKAADAIILAGPLGSLFILAVIGLVVACVILGFVIRTLWKTLQEQNLAMGALREKRGDDADARAERFASVVTSSNATGDKLITAIAGIEGRTKDMADVMSQLPALAEATLKGLDRNSDKMDRVFDTLRVGARP